MAQIAGEASGKFLFGITAEMAAQRSDRQSYLRNLDRFGRRPDDIRFAGADSGLAGVPGGEPEWEVRLHLRPDLRQRDQVNDPMEGFAFSTGTLTELGTSPFAGLNANVGKFDQSGQYIFAIADVPNSSSSGQYAYGVDASGRVTSSLPHAGAVNAGYAVTDEP